MDSPRTPGAQVLPAVLSVTFAANLFLLTHVGFRPHGARGWLELLLFFALELSFIVFATRAAIGYVDAQRANDPRHQAPPG